MEIEYFNYSSRLAVSRWDRASFVKNWWRIYTGDRHWPPPYYPLLRRELEPARNRHLARLEPVFAWIEARQRRTPGKKTRDRHSPFDLPLETAVFDLPVAAAAALQDPRREDRTAYLALLHCVNDSESLERLLDYLAEEMGEAGCQRILGPTGISPYLGSGLLLDYWDLTPPLDTAYDPPYLLEIVQGTLESAGRSRLYHLDVPAEPLPMPESTVEISAVETGRLAADLLPLFQSGFDCWQECVLSFPAPDAEEAAFLLRWTGIWPLQAWLARWHGQPAGFVLLSPDLAPQLIRSRGGRVIWNRLVMRLAINRPAGRGRILFGGVLPSWRGKGIGRQLLQRSLAAAQDQGWRHLTAGPVPEGSQAEGFLAHFGARPRQSYGFYQMEL